MLMKYLILGFLVFVIYRFLWKPNQSSGLSGNEKPSLKDDHDKSEYVDYEEVE